MARPQWASLSGHAALFSFVSMKELSATLPPFNKTFPSDEQPGEMARAASLSKRFS